MTFKKYSLKPGASPAEIHHPKGVLYIKTMTDEDVEMLREQYPETYEQYFELAKSPKNESKG